MPRLNKGSLPFYYDKSREAKSMSRCYCCYFISCSVILLGLLFTSLGLFILCDRGPFTRDAFGRQSDEESIVEKNEHEKGSTIPTWDELATYYPAKLMDDGDESCNQVETKDSEQKDTCDLAFIIVLFAVTMVIFVIILVLLLNCKA